MNGIKTDNRIENLQLIDHGAHARLTHTGHKRGGWKLKLSDAERKARSDRMKHARAAIAKAEGVDRG